MMRQRIEPTTCQESVWDYPRPPKVVDTTKHVQIIFNGVTIAETHHAKRLLETSHPPVYYIPPADIRMDFLTLTPKATFCEWKGIASYYSITVADRTVKNVAWSYLNPTAGFDDLRGYLAFYPSRMDACYVDGELAVAQIGDFYGGWITQDVVGPFKGEPGSWGW